MSSSQAKHHSPSIANRLFEELEKWSDWSENIEIKLSSETSMIPGGNNGPYFDLETPLRNTAHWISLHSILFNVSEDKKFYERALRLRNFLVKQNLYAKKYGYVFRQKPGKDSSNGIIGPAWLAEGLGKAGLYLKDEVSLSLAKRIVSSFPFSKKDKAWNKVDPENGISNVDYTYNHESWFAAIKAEIVGPSNDVNEFLDHSNQFSFRVHPSGLISHLLYSNSLRGLKARTYFSLNQYRKPEFFKHREIGYQLFVLFSLARLKAIYPSHPLFVSQALKRAIKFIDNTDFFDALTHNKYAYSYNSPACEFALVGLTWSSEFKNINVEEKVFEILKYARSEYSPWAPADRILKLPDSLTLFSRIYELAITLEHLH